MHVSYSDEHQTEHGYLMQYLACLHVISVVALVPRLTTLQVQ